MSSIPPQEREILADDFFDNIFPGENNSDSYQKPESFGLYRTARSKSYPETPNKYSPSSKDWRSVTAKASPTSGSPPDNSFLPSVKNLTCYFWARQGKCKWSDRDCLYAHHHTGKLAGGPVQIEQGKPAVAGKNALNTHPVYLDWRAGLSQSNGTPIQPDIQKQIDFIEAKAHEQNINIIKHGFDQKTNIMGIGVKSGQGEPANNYRVDHDFLGASPTLPAPRKPAPLSPEFGYSSIYHAVSASQQPTQHARTNGDEQHASIPPLQQSNQPSHPGRQMICPHPLDHLKAAGINHELVQTIQMMVVKDKAIRQLAQALDTAIENMELQQQGAAKEVQTLLKLAKYQMAKGGHGEDFVVKGNGHGMHLNPNATFNDYASAQVSAHNDMGNGSSHPRNPNTPDVASKATGVGDNLMHMMQREKRCIDHLKAAKESVGNNMENLGEEDVLPKGWLSRDFTI